MIATRALSALLTAVAAVAFPWAVARAQDSQLEADVRLFTVMAALNAAGYDQGLGSPSDSPVREAVRRDLAKVPDSIRTRLRNFYEQAQLPDPGENLAQYVSFALLCGEPPGFELNVELPTDLPPDVRNVRALSTLLAEFYQQADIETLWNRYQPAYEQEIARYQEPLIEALFEAMGFLRVSPTSRQAQSFKVYFDLLAAPNQINTRSYKGFVHIVVHASQQPRINEIRHAFLLHLLDPLSIRHGADVAQKEVLSRFALFAPALEETYKTDFQLLVSKSLVKAVEARLGRVPEEKRLARVNEDMRQGFILTPYFYEKLAEFLKQDQDMARYYPEMIKAIDPKREAARLQNVEFAEPERKPTAPPRPQISAGERLLQQAELLLEADQLKDAREKFLEASEISGGENAQATYGLGRVAISEGDADLAREYFLEAIGAGPDPGIESMCHVYIARIEDILGNREQAIEHYQLALATKGIPQQARQLAEKGLAEPFLTPRQKAAIAAEGAENEESPEDEEEDAPR